MLNRDRLLAALLTLLLLAFGLGVARLVRLRFERGDVYPPYSSFRADPLGTKALHDGLRGVRGLNVERHLRELPRLGEAPGTALLVLGADPEGLEEVPEPQFAELDRFLRQGGRLVITFRPLAAEPDPTPSAARPARRAPRSPTGPGERSDPEPAERRLGPREEGDPSPPRRLGRRLPVGDRDDDPEFRTVSLAKEWGVELKYVRRERTPEGALEPAVARAREPGREPAALEWRTALYFGGLATNWSRVYAWEDRAVVVERRHGAGTLVLASDSYWVSNESLREDRQPELLAWLIGANRRVLFDESHLGVSETPGIASLLRQYRLHGLVAGCLLLAGLFVWKQSVAFLPAYEEEADDAALDPVAGRDSAAGFVNLLRRSIRPSEIVAVCFEEWRKSAGPGRHLRDPGAQQMAALVAEEQGRPVGRRRPLETYRTLARLARERRGHRVSPSGAAEHRPGLAPEVRPVDPGP